MIHQIKNCINTGMGINSTAKYLNIDKKTVAKYNKMSESAIEEYLNNRNRCRRLDIYKGFIASLLEKYPLLKTPKIIRKLKEKGLAIPVKERAFRLFISSVKKELTLPQKRYYTPVIETVPGMQAQVDLGEIRALVVGEEKITIYFAIMTLCFSRKMYLYLSAKPFNTKTFIEFHDSAFAYFGGVPEEIVYDQTKLVVISEKYREVFLNETFYQYATKAGFSIHVCEGYDPESKGKVEANVKYAKRDFFYGEPFADFNDLEKKCINWLNEVANKRIHGTTKESPDEKFEKEKNHLKPYTSVLLQVNERETRRADLTSLISVDGNRYSVPHKYQSNVVGINKTQNGYLIVYDCKTGEIIARWLLGIEKGKIHKNTNHYRDYSETIFKRETIIKQKLPSNISEDILRLLKQHNPKIYRDQLLGLEHLCRKYSSEIIYESVRLLKNNFFPVRISSIASYCEAVKEKEQSKILISSQNCEKYHTKTNNNSYFGQHSLSAYRSVEVNVL